MNRSQRWPSIVFRSVGFSAVFWLLFNGATTGAAQHESDHFRPPAVPLIVSNPYLSIWSPADHLTDATTQHWTKHEHPLMSLIRIDGKSYRLMGTEPKDVPAMKQVGLQVLPTPASTTSTTDTYTSRSPS